MGVDLPNFAHDWDSLCQQNFIYPSWAISSFLHEQAPPPSASHLSTKSLHSETPASLFLALSKSHLDRDTWYESFREEKESLIHVDTFTKIPLEEYRQLQEKGAPKAIPTMYVLTVKNDNNFNPERVKTRIVALGNHKNHAWENHERFVLFLQYYNLHYRFSRSDFCHHHPFCIIHSEIFALLVMDY